MKVAIIAIFSTLIILILGIALVSATNNSSIPSGEQSTQSQGGDMSNHHKATQPANDNIFSSLLNKEAPDFTLQSFDGKITRLKDLRGKKIVLFFTEGIMCYPACWNQMASLGKDVRLNTNKVVSLSITVDKREDWQQAVKQMPDLASGTILLDSDRLVSSQYGVLTLSSSMHKGQFPGHTYLIVDEKGIVRFEFDDAQMGVRNDQLVQELGKIN